MTYLVVGFVVSILLILTGGLVYKTHRRVGLALSVFAGAILGFVLLVASS